MIVINIDYDKNMTYLLCNFMSNIFKDKETKTLKRIHVTILTGILTVTLSGQEVFIICTQMRGIH